MNRRQFSRVLATVAGLASGLIPLRLFAAYPEKAFDAEATDAVTQELYGADQPEESSAITIKGPDIAENGAVVPISVSADIPNVDSVAILVANNPSPLAATFEFPTPSASAVNVGTRIKMGKTSPLIALVRADGKLYTATSGEIKVTIGGCGG